MWIPCLLATIADALAGWIKIDSLPEACRGENDGPPLHQFLNSMPITPDKTGTALMIGCFKILIIAGIVMQKRPEDKMDLLQNYPDTYFTRDLKQLSNIEKKRIYCHITSFS